MDDLYKWVMGALFAMLTAATSALVKSVLVLREKTVTQEERIKRLEEAQVTTDDIRQVMKDVLVEHDELHRLKMEKAISDGIKAHEKECREEEERR